MPATRSLELLVGNSQMWSALSPFAIAPGSRANRKEPNYFLLFAGNPLAISHPTDVGSGNVTAFSGLCLFPKAPLRYAGAVRLFCSDNKSKTFIEDAE